MSWFVKGDAPNRTDFIKNAYQSKANSFWLNKGETREVIFLDDAKFGVYEHKLNLGGRFKTFTCSGGDCMLCGLEKPRSYGEYYSILDLTPYKSKKDGKDHKYSKRALGVGKEIAALLDMRRKDAGGTLQAKKFRVSRIGEKAHACGNDWTYMPSEKQIDLSKLPPEYKAYNFEEVLRPRPVSEIQAILNYSGSNASNITPRDSISGSSPITEEAGQNETFDAEADIPF